MDKNEHLRSNDMESELLEKQYDSIEEFIVDHPAPLEMEKYLTIGALLTTTYEEPYETLSLMGDKEDYQYELEFNWGISNKEEVIAAINWLLIDGYTERNQNDYTFLRKNGFEAYQGEFGEDGVLSEEDLANYISAIKQITEALGLEKECIEYCESLVAWDLEQIGLLSRMACHVGYLTEKEALEFLQYAAKIAKDYFEDWEEYIVSAIIGRSISMDSSEIIILSALNILKDNRGFLDANPIQSL